MDDDANARAELARRGNPFLNTKHASRYLGLSVRFLERMRGQKAGPRFRYHGRFVFYHIDDLDAWSRASTSRSKAHD